jgi:hypothetical protein
MSAIAINTSAVISQGYLKRSRVTTLGVDFVASTPLVAAGVPSIGFAAHEAIVMQDVASAGWARFCNTSATNFILIGTDSTGTFIPFLKLLAGEEVWVRLGTNAPYAKADTAAVLLDYEIFQA